MATTSNDKPTSRQLSYLKSLANRTGQTFTYPQTSRQASAEINRLKQTKPTSRTERYIERKLIADQIATGPLDAARVRDDEIHGRGTSKTAVSGPSVRRAQNSCIMRLPKLASGADSRHSS